MTEKFSTSLKPVLVEVSVPANQYHISSWLPYEAATLYLALEEPNWAPWLAASPETLAGRSRVFPAGQLVMKDLAGNYLASLSLNQINWDGDKNHLPTWDAVAGEPTDYSQTYRPDGNTLVLLSMNVAPSQKGKQLPAQMIKAAEVLGKELNCHYLIGSFRPSGYGKAKQETGFDIDFWQYCQMRKPGTNKPFDPWLRSLDWVGMEMLAVDHQAMKVNVSLAEFEGYRMNYKPELWVEVESDNWECGEVGHWTIDKKTGIATYIESNVWGRIPI